MHKNFSLYFILIFFTFQFAGCQVLKSESKNLERCEIYLKPLLGFNIKFNQEKNQLLSLFDSYEIDSDVTNVAENSEKEFYKVRKQLNLKGKENVQLVGLVVFGKQNHNLLSYDFELYIGNDIPFYRSLIDELEKVDVEKKNSFIYERKRLYNSSRNKGCYRSFSFGRSNDDENNFVLKIRHSN